MTKPKKLPRSYTKKLADEILKRLAAGESLTSICREKKMPARQTVSLWAVNDVDGFADRYARARDEGLDVLAEELLEIADTPMEGTRTEESEHGVKTITEDMLGHRRLQVDARKWYLSKLAPKKYGDKQDINVSGTVDIASTILAARKRSGTDES